MTDTTETTEATETTTRTQRLRWRKTPDKDGNIVLTLGGKVVATCHKDTTESDRTAIEDGIRKDMGLPARQTKKTSGRLPPTRPSEE